MKRIFLYLLLSLILASFLIAGCNQQTSAPSTAAPKTTTPAASTQPPAAQDVIKIGHIRPLTGNMAQSSDRMVKAFDWAFSQVAYQVAGKKIQIIIGDSKGDTATAIDVARKMVENDHVAMIAGPTQAGEIMAVAGYINPMGIPMLLTNPGEPPGIIAQHLKWIIGGGGTQPEIASCMGVYAYEQLGLRKVDILTGDFVPGHGFLGCFMDPFKKRGGQIVQETYFPYPTQDFAPYLTVLKDADAVVAWIDGDQAIKLLTQYHELGIDKRLRLVGAFHGSFLAPYTLSGLQPAAADATIGDLVPVPYSPLLDTAFNKKWVADYQAKFGGLPEDTDSGPYQGAMCIIEALKATNGDFTPEKLRQALISVNFEGPEGPVKFDPATSASIKTIYIAKIAKQGNAYIWQPVFSYKDVSPMGLQ